MPLLSLAEMAAELGISAKTFRKDVRGRQIPFYPVGKRMRFDGAEVRACLRTVEEAPPPQAKVKPFSVRKRPRKVTSRKFDIA